MKTQIAIELFGSPSKLAAALGVTPGAVSQWVAKGEVPLLRVYQLRELCPDLNVCLSDEMSERRQGKDRRAAERRAK